MGLVGEGGAIEVVALDYESGVEAAALRSVTRSGGLSLGVRACLALAMRTNERVLTADTAWATIPLGIEVELIR